MSASGIRFATGPTAHVAAQACEELAVVAPALVPGFTANLARAVDVVTRRLVGAAAREGLNDGPVWAGDRSFVPLADGGYLVADGHRYAFDRLEVTQRLDLDPAAVVRRIAGDTDEARSLGAELSDAVVGLALAYARQPDPGPPGPADSLDLVAGLDPDEAGLRLERLAVEGHNLHPCGRTRLGWSMADRLAYDLESPGLTVRYLGLHRDYFVGDDLPHPPATIDARRYAVIPVHPWQWDQIVRHRYADLLGSGAIVALDAGVAARPTAALRTLLVPADGYLKVSLDILVTSTRRSISIASTRNAVPVSTLLTDLLDATGLADRVLLMTETAGAAGVVSAQRSRDLAAIVRTGLSGRLGPGEVAVPGGALCASSPITGATVVADLVERYARTRGLTATAAAPGFVVEYARLLLTPVLTLAMHGVGLEAHLQNCVPTFVDGVPHRLGLRDLAGLRLHPPRLHHPPVLWPGSVVVAPDLDTMRAKAAYTALQAHLGEVILHLTRSHRLGEDQAWAAVRTVLDEVYAGLAPDERARADHAYFTAPTLPHKALLSMRLAALRGDARDIYVRVENPLR